MPVTSETNPKTTELNQADLSAEIYREYDFGGRTYRISDPVTLFTRLGGTTHRVLDKNGVVHCVPAVGQNGCVLRWVNKDAKNPVNF